MNAELVLAMRMAHLASDWDAEAAALERAPDDELCHFQAAILRSCAEQLRERLEIHRSGPAFAIPPPSGWTR